jgi:hypothetical protein
MSLTSFVVGWDIPGYNLATLFTGLLVTVLLIHVVPYVLDRQHIRRYPGPLLAGFSDAWLAWVARQGRIMTAVHEEHAKRGKPERIFSISSCNSEMFRQANSYASPPLMCPSQTLLLFKLFMATTPDTAPLSSQVSTHRLTHSLSR